MKSELVKIGYELNNPLRIYKGSLDIKPIFSCNNSNIIIETVFVNDKGNIAVRMYETAGIKTVAKVKSNINFISVKQTDMLFENPNDVDLDAMTFKPFEIKTLEVKR